MTPNEQKHVDMLNAHRIHFAKLLLRWVKTGEAPEGFWSTRVRDQVFMKEEIDAITKDCRDDENYREWKDKPSPQSLASADYHNFLRQVRVLWGEIAQARKALKTLNERTDLDSSQKRQRRPMIIRRYAARRDTYVELLKSNQHIIDANAAYIEPVARGYGYGLRFKTMEEFYGPEYWDVDRLWWVYAAHFIEFTMLPHLNSKLAPNDP